MPDILFANRCGFRSILVFSGVSEKQDMERLRDSEEPSDVYLKTEFYSNSIDEVKKFIDVELHSESDYNDEDDEEEESEEEDNEECDYEDENHEKDADEKSDEDNDEDCKQKYLWRNFFLGHPNFKSSTDDQSYF